MYLETPATEQVLTDQNFLIPQRASVSLSEHFDLDKGGGASVCAVSQ